MEFKRILFVFLQIFLGCKSEPVNQDTLKLVQVIFRHGDRAPTKYYPNDPYIDDFDKLWPEGFAQLTNVGKRQQFELGKFLRNRYDGYLDKTYSPSELYVASSDMDRTIMSLESNLAGLFPPVENPWSSEINWQPIPLRTIPRKEDKFLHNYVKCPRYSTLRRNFYSSSDVVLSLNKKHQDFIEYCADHSGLDITTVKGLYPLLDILYAQRSHNYTLPAWAEGDTLPKLLELTGITNQWPTFTDEMKRLWGGPFLHLLIKNMKAVAGYGHVSSHDDDIPVNSVKHGVNRKLLMYSAHDSTLNRIMNTMGIFEPHCPPYASALIIELHQDQDSLEYFIEFHYRNETGRTPYVLKHPKCEQPCSLETYEDLTQHLIPKNWKQECGNLDDSGMTLNNLQAEFPKVPRSMPTLESSCFPTSSQWLLVGFGIIVCSIFASLILIQVLQWRQNNGMLDSDYVISSNRPHFVQLFSPSPSYQATYERI